MFAILLIVSAGTAFADNTSFCAVTSGLNVCNLYETDASGTPSEISSASLLLPYETPQFPYVVLTEAGHDFDINQPAYLALEYLNIGRGKTGFTATI